MDPEIIPPGALSWAPTRYRPVEPPTEEYGRRARAARDGLWRRFLDVLAGRGMEVVLSPVGSDSTRITVQMSTDDPDPRDALAPTDTTDAFSFPQHIVYLETVDDPGDGWSVGKAGFYSFANPG